MLRNFVGVVLVLALFVSTAVGCGRGAGSLSKEHTFAELRTIKGAITVSSEGQTSRPPFRRERLIEGQKIVAPPGALAWMRRDGGATWLVSGPAELTVKKDEVTVAHGRAFVDTEQGEPVVVVTPEGRVELSGARVSVEVSKGVATAYVLRGTARTPGSARAAAGEMLTLRGGKTEKKPVVSWQDWTGGLGTADPSAAPAPFGIGTVGARPPGDQGKPRSSLVIERLQVNVTIDRDLAITEVDQTFVNPTSQTVEGLFRFRTPSDAILGQFGVDRHGKLVWGRVKESKSAQQVYESHVYEGSTEDPALLSWVAPGVFSARLYPIHGGEKRRVVTRYSEWLPRQGEKAERRLYVYPMAAEGAKGSLPRIEEMTIDVDVSRAGAKWVRSGMEGVREGDHILVKAFDFVPRSDLAIELYDDGQPTLVGYRAPHALGEDDIPEGSSREYAARVSSAEADYVAVPLRVPGDGKAEKGIDLAIVVDASAATEPAALSIARSLASSLLSHLGPEDKVALWAGDATLWPVYPGSEKLSSLDEPTRKKWLSGLSKIERGGATDLGALLTGAASVLGSERAGAVIYIGDGSPSVGEVAPGDLRERLQRLPSQTRILPVAVGSQPNVSLLDQVSRGADVHLVEDGYGAARAALTILETVGRRAWVGAKVDLGTGVERLLPEVLPPLSADETVMIVGRRTGKLPQKLVLEGAQGKHEQSIEFERLEDRGDLRRRWGTRRLSSLLEEGAGRATLVDLSMRFALVSPFTSLYVPTHSEEEREDYTDPIADYEAREARLLRWKPWARGSSLLAKSEPMAASIEEEAAVTDNKEGGTGTRAKGEEGSMGSAAAPSPVQAESSKRYAVAGPKDSDDPHISRQAPVESQSDFGMIGLLNSGAAGAPPPPPGSPAEAAPRPEEMLEAKAVAPSTHSRPSHTTGNMWGTDTASADPLGGLGMIGTGDGGGGVGAGQGFGSGHGRLGGTQKAASARVKFGAMSVSGRLPSEVIQRIIRQNFGRFRLCYEQGLARNPSLEGRVGVRFVIDNTGALTLADNGGSDLPDSAVTSCVINSFYTLSFPAPEGGTVTGMAPLMFTTGGGVDPLASLEPSPSELPVSTSIGAVGHQPVPCGRAADLPLSDRRALWGERLAGANVGVVLSVYRRALADCEATNWRERVALLVLMVDHLSSVYDRVALFRTLLATSPGAADAVYRFLVLRVRTAEDLRQLHEALGFAQVDPDVLRGLLTQGKTPAERLTLLRGVAEKFPDDSELALRVLWAYEDAGDEAGGRGWARKLRLRVDATSHLRTSVGEYYLRLAERAADPESSAARYDRAEGMRTFGEIVEFAPEDPLARRHLGDLLSAHGWYDEALRQYETLARLTPDDPTVHLFIARATAGTGKTERAVHLAEKAGESGAPDSAQPVSVAARALSGMFLAEARIAAEKAGRKDELSRLRGRASRLSPDQSSGAVRVLLTWSHPELRPTLWTNTLGTMMPSPDNFPLLGVAAARTGLEPAPRIEVRLDSVDAEHAARLGLRAKLTVLLREGADDEVILMKDLSFRPEEGGKSRESIVLELSGMQLVEVLP